MIELVGETLAAYTIDDIHQYLEIGDLDPRDVAILLEPRYEDQDLQTGEYLLSENERWTIGIHVRPLDQLTGADSTYNADITVEFDNVPTDVFTKNVYPDFVRQFEEEFGGAELRYLDPDDL
ncbi:MAG: hypothetical protein ABEI52_09975 [Halobacteriaceae archaeon]